MEAMAVGQMQQQQQGQQAPAAMGGTTVKPVAGEQQQQAVLSLLLQSELLSLSLFLSSYLYIFGGLDWVRSCIHLQYPAVFYGVCDIGGLALCKASA